MKKPRKDKVIKATIGEYHDYGSHVWVSSDPKQRKEDEALIRSLEEYGIKVIRHPY